MEKEPEYLVSSRCEEGEAYLDGAKQMPCHKCGHDVWVSPSSLPILESKPDMEIMCLQCAQEMAESEDEEVKIIPLSDLQKKEISQAGWEIRLLG